MQASRVSYWNVDSHLLMYPLALLVMLICAFGFFKIMRILKKGRPAGHFKALIKNRLRELLRGALLQERILEEPFPALIHFFIFWGFIALYIGTCLEAIHANWGIKILEGSFYLVFSLTLDLAGLFAMAAISLAMFRRYILRPKRLENKSDDFITLILIFMILLTGFIVEGFRMAVTELPVHPSWAVWSPVGLAFANFYRHLSFSLPLQQELHWYFWWFHMALAFAFIAYIPYSKLKHIFTSSANIALQEFNRKGSLPDEDLENSESFGITNIEDTNWKGLLELYACTECGRCQDRCPAFATGKPLNPKKIITQMRGNLEDKKNHLLGLKKDEYSKFLIGDFIKEDELWACTTCGACQEHCPVFIEHVKHIVGMRRSLVLMDSKFPNELKNMFKGMEVNGNPWAVGVEKRTEWMKDLELKTFSEGAKAEYLLWVGCAGSIDSRALSVTNALIKVLKAAKVDFAVLAGEERCCGEAAKRLGNEYLYQTLADANIEIFKKYGIKKIITPCPHCFNTFKNEYPSRGYEVEVRHHTEILDELLQKGALKVSKGIDTRMAYHDSCYLGRHNGIYGQPRKILETIPQARLTEAGRKKSESFCCGAGGGRMWMEEKLGTRINHARTRELLDTKADIIATACPYCLTMFTDGVKDIDAESKVQVKDIAEIIANAL
ncbi:MAG: 4Fe-4S dicluster domain-containing protein [Planctomycetes bacterium]|nr:4Fe-4S dicluster domain-containing protein [Planctomycetota bacterium]